ncbi:MAG: hypothetical protein JNK23_11620 [Opitutaceae bacterium]|nr:hypothetical protein [Opitutaceae bacterium]
MSAAPTTTRREVKWNLLLQYSGIGFMLVQGVVLVPVYLRYVGSAEFGLWLIAGGVATWVAVIDPGISALMQQRVSRALGSERRGQAVRLARRGLRINAVLTGVMIVVGASASGWLARSIDPRATVPEQTGWWLVFLSVAGVAANLMANALTSLGVALRAARAHTIVTLVSASAGIAATLVGLVLGGDVLALAVGVLVRGGLQALLAYPLVQVELRALGAADDDRAADETQQLDGRALAWAAFDKIVGTFALSADLFFLGRGFEVATVTSYALTKKPVDLLLGCFQRLVVALAPAMSFLSGGPKAGEASAFIVAMGARTLWLLGGAGLGTALLLESLVGWWVGPAQYAGGNVAGILAAGLGVSVGASFFGNLYFASGVTSQFYMLNGSISLLTIPAMLGGLHYHGIVGLLIGAFLPRVLALGLFAVLAIRVLSMATPEKRMMAGELAITLMATITGLVVAAAVSGERWIGGLAGLVAYGVVIAAASGRFRGDLRKIATMGRGWVAGRT